MKGWMAALLLVVLVAACGDNNDPGDTSLTIDNESGVVVAFVQYSDCADPEWGPDRLDDDEFIEDGERRSFDVDPGCYDIRVTFVGGSEVIELDNQIDDGEEFVLTLD
jgi:hypothetical protein